MLPQKVLVLNKVLSLYRESFLCFSEDTFQKNNNKNNLNIRNSQALDETNNRTSKVVRSKGV